jgi:hypothetical protein
VLYPTRELTNLSLCVNGESFPARFGPDRADVGVTFPEAPMQSGFLISAPLKQGRYLVTLEAQLKDLSPEVFVAPDILIVKRANPKRIAMRAARAAGFRALQRQIAPPPGLWPRLPSWRDIGPDASRSTESARRGGTDSGLPLPEGFTLPRPSIPTMPGSPTMLGSEAGKRSALVCEPRRIFRRFRDHRTDRAQVLSGNRGECALAAL